MSSPVIGSSTLANINGIASQSKTTGTNSGSELNDRFMTLLVTQLKNQDPTNPMENSEMTAQLAQINTVSGIQKLNDSLSAITQQIDAGQALQATALIGKGVMVPGNNILVGRAGDSDTNVVATPIGVDLEQDVQSLQIDIRGANGEVVDSFSTGPMKAGVHSFTWDGVLADGTNAAAENTYTASISGKVGDETFAPQTLNYALVNGVMRGADGPRLDLGYAQDPVALSAVRQIL
ncbi:flagellar hook assembly protein FlgD [Salinicola endophyticus]|uniref:Basal-body rod modification protein FlgD n=1 Tax=Salinicola endophyticus TaxID=1949083 RepID=A0ABY8FJV9_9GAMM|nr:flagellar hook assembly protein FlgD [Salinicola endophyticus]WFF42822.1 flagellar hook assembly protein FlgD [Salinicola endophyticus]